jgi:glycosyl transferase family 25
MFKRVYYINLAHRTDRREQIESELDALKWREIAVRVEAVHRPERGALGCLLSHITALRMFLEEPAEITSAVILEDDCMFRPDALTEINAFLAEHRPSDWDVLMLASNTWAEETYKPYATKILNAQTAAAYAITRPFAKSLLAYWERTVPFFEFKEVKYPQCDMTWKILQPQNRWYCLLPKAATQRQSYSDIENRVVFYGV